MERERLRRAALAALWVLAAAATAALLVRVAGPGGGGGEARACAAPADTPGAVRDRFVATAVLRVQTACSYDLVTETLRQGLSRREWASGTIPVIPFHTRLTDRVHVETRPRAAASGRRASLVLLSAPDIGAYAFEVVLVRQAGRWLVDYWNALSAVPAASG